ncbi:very short patch repair endonuclease [Sphingopyxis chilensis]|uniref:very short patch repair endonuclease n=1 Tax=Sphingopyxis chilensis TaxID=180400 RepID=UPI002DDD87EF|nr:very short patch repair endonuclease [Sphingopyxis chilensis]
MKKVRRRDTAPEMLVRQRLHARSWRYRLQVKSLPGTPDIVFVARRAVIFVNGCFWHGHDCKAGRPPKSRPEFWAPKLAANRERDARKVAELVAAGWRVMTVWQCSLKNLDATIDAIENFLNSDTSLAETRGDSRAKQGQK